MVTHRHRETGAGVQLSIILAGKLGGGGVLCRDDVVMWICDCVARDRQREIGCVCTPFYNHNAALA